MADKKWSEFDLLKSIKDKNIELLTVIEDNESITGYDNKRVKLSDILDPINQKIQHLNLTIYQILTGDIDLLTIGVDTLPKPWYENTSVPGDTLLVELSIAKDLKREIDSTVTKVETLENEVVNIKTNIEEIVGDVLINKTNIEVLGDLVDIIENNYYNKNDILNEVLPDIEDKAPSSEAVFNFVDLTKNTIEYNINNEVLQINNTIEDKSLENKNYTDIEIQKILNKIANLEIDSFYFDNNAKDGEFCVDYDIESVVINKSTQKIFVVEDNKLYKELSLNRPEVLEIANEVVDLHRDNINKSFKNGVYNLKGEDQHITYNGKYVGKTNAPDLTFVGITPEGDNSYTKLEVIKADDSYLFFKKINGLESDFYALIRPDIDKVTYYEDRYDFINCIKSEYKTFFNKPFVVKCFVELDYIKFDMRYNSYFSNSVKLNNFSNFFNFIPLAISCKRCDDFYKTNSSEVFNDYRQSVPVAYDNFHSVNNLNNKFLESTTIDVEFYPITYLDTNDLECIYALECKSSNVNLLDYVGYYIKLKASKYVNVVLSDGTEGTSRVDNAFGDMTDPLNMDYRIYLILLGVNQNGKKCPIITRSVELNDGIYNSIATRYFNMYEILRKGMLIAKGYLKIEYDGAELIPHGLSSDSYSDLIYENTPSFIMGENNLWHLGEFILGDNNIPTHSIFTIAHKKYDVHNPYNHEIGQELFNRDNIFEVNQNGLIFIKSSKELSRWYENLYGEFTKKPEDKDTNGNVIRTNNEVLNLEYKCLQKILIELMEKIDTLDLSISQELEYADTLSNRISRIERELNIS